MLAGPALRAFFSFYGLPKPTPEHSALDLPLELVPLRASSELARPAAHALQSSIWGTLIAVTESPGSHIECPVQLSICWSSRTPHRDSVRQAVLFTTN